MTSQLQAIVDDFRAAQTRLGALADRVPDDWWDRRPDPARWSIAECIAHLNLTSSAFLPLVRKALAALRRLDAPAPRRHRRDPIGWVLWKVMGPPVRVRVRTPATFVPTRGEARQTAVSAFSRCSTKPIQRPPW